ncbi:MAG: VOC family protein [Candidatus Heimdallarchaeota archaeon]
MSTNFHHVGIVVHDIEIAMRNYCKALGIDKESIKINTQEYLTGKGELEEFIYSFIPLGNDCYIELVSPLTDGPTKRYLDKKGEGLFHLAFESTKIEQTISEFGDAGFDLAGQTPTEQTLSVFFHPKTAHGVLLQLMKKRLLHPDGSPNLEVITNS